MVYYILLAITLILFVLLHAVIFPSIFLKTGGVAYGGDRGVMDIDEEGGRSIIYSPAVKYTNAVKHYLISERDGKKQLKCEVNENLRYIEYDIRMYDESGNMFNVLNVKEALSGDGYGKTVDLDENTAYVSLIVIKADGRKYPAAKMKKVRGGSVFLYILCCAIAEIVSVFLVKVCLAEIFGGIYHESFIFSLYGTIVTAIVCAVIIIVNIIVTLVAVRRFNRGKLARGGKNA